MDLSKLLGELYTAEDGHVATEEEAPSPPDALEASLGPEWADESRLDLAFASWVPGPTADAPAAEREMAYSDLPSSFDGLGTDQPRPSTPEGAGDEAQAGPSKARSWTPSDDDVLPYRRRRGRRLSLLRR